jgi:hypothetical protein
MANAIPFPIPAVQPDHGADANIDNPVVGTSANGPAVMGESSRNKATGFLGGTDPFLHAHAGVYGECDDNGVFGRSTGATGIGVRGFSTGAGSFALRGDTEGGIAVKGKIWAPGGFAGDFEGPVNITGNLTHTGGLATFEQIQTSGPINLVGPAADVVFADCAEGFDTALGTPELQPGTVVVLDGEGALRESSEAYDKKVAGVVSGAGDYRPAIVLDKRTSEQDRATVALIGKAYCKVDAHYGPIEVGDLLTTSPTPGHAMKASDSRRAFGAVIGKALRPLQDGRGLLPVLVALQ